MLIILTTSGIGSRLGDMTKYTNKSLLRIGNKYTIDYIIKLYRYKENIKFIVTLGYFGSHVKQYLSLAYPNINFIYVEIDNYCNDGSSLCYSLLLVRNILMNRLYIIVVIL